MAGLKRTPGQRQAAPAVAAVAAVAATVAGMHLPGATTHPYPKLQLLVVKTARFEQLETVRDQIAAAFPAAKFDLPVVYFPKKPR